MNLGILKSGDVQEIVSQDLDQPTNMLSFVLNQFALIAFWLSVGGELTTYKSPL